MKKNILEIQASYKKHVHRMENTKFKVQQKKATLERKDNEKIEEKIKHKKCLKNLSF